MATIDVAARTPASEGRSADAAIGGEELAELMREVLADRIFGTAGQLYVEAGGVVVVDGGWGDCGGWVVDADSVHPAFCATKPVLALAVGHAVDRGLLDLDARVADLAPVVGVASGVTVRHVLAHRAGLRHPSAPDWSIASEERRHLLLPSVPPAPTAAYSEIRGWQVLTEVLEAVGAGSTEALVTDTIVDPLDLGGLCVTASSALGALADGRVRVPVGGLPVEVVPMLSEQLPIRVREASPIFGGLISMGSLGRLYSAVKAALGGIPTAGVPAPETLRDLVVPIAEAAWDPVLRRCAGFGGGFMVGMADHRISDRASIRAVGHTAGLANCVGFCDPEEDLAVALYLNGSALSQDDIETMRLAILDRIVAMCGRRGATGG
jgi:CubicO group peptidase (beta-lactamase class C family)